MNETKNSKTKALVEVSLFIAIICVMAYVPVLGYIPLGPINATTLHIPVILASIILGPKKGAIIGFVFGLSSLLTNTFRPTLLSFAFSPFYSLGDISGNWQSLIICFVPRILVGIIPFFVFKFFKKFSKNSDVLPLSIAGIAGALSNTILVMSMIYLFFCDTFAYIKDIHVEEVFKIILGIVLTNGIPEAIVAGVVTLAVGKALLLYKKHNA